MISIFLYGFFLLLVFFQLRAAYRLEGKYRFQFLNYFKAYLIFYCIYGFIKYVEILFSYQFIPIQTDKFPDVKVLAILMFPFFSIVMYYLLLWIRYLVEKETSRKIIILYWSTQFTLLLFMTYCYFIDQNILLPGLARSWNLIHIPVVVILFIIIGQIFFSTKAFHIEIKKTFVKNLGIIYMLSFALYEAFQQLIDPFLRERELYFYAIGGGIYFCINIPALFYIHRFMTNHHTQLIELNIGIDQMSRFSEQFNITSREKEIIEMIIKGKTNRNIGESLYISVQTVKNIISNIYRKTNVKNRLQLLRLIQNIRDINNDSIIG